MLTFHILRYKPGVIDPPEFQEFAVPVTPEMSVLDALEYIRLELDATLMYRHSCHHSSCGTCACVINGVARLTCVTNALSLQTPVITLEPLRGFRCEGDLVVDMTDFYEYICDEWSYLRQSELDQQKNSTRLETCVECGCCVSSCPVTQTGVGFMGPAALAAINAEWQKAPEQRDLLRQLAHGEHGERWCERAIECSRVCPTKVAPAKHIAELRSKRTEA